MEEMGNNSILEIAYKRLQIKKVQLEKSLRNIFFLDE